MEMQVNPDFEFVLGTFLCLNQTEEGSGTNSPIPAKAASNLERTVCAPWWNFGVASPAALQGIAIDNLPFGKGRWKMQVNGWVEAWSCDAW